MRTEKSYDLPPMAALTRELIRRLPKTDLHLHLDGSLRLPTLIEMARAMNVKMPSETEAGLRETVFRDHYADLGEYLHGFKYTCAVLQNAENLERAAAELAEDNQAEGVRYIEVRFAPQLHAHGTLDTVEVLRAVDRGLRSAKAAFNRRPEIAGGAEPPFEYGIIACAMRYFDERFSPFHRAFVEAHRYSPPERVYGLATVELVRAAERARDRHGVPVVGIDLAGPEDGYPPRDHREAYLYAHRRFFRKTVHAGEAYGPESVFQAITELHAERIGHGTLMLDPTAIRSKAILDRDDYVRDLAEFVADRRITIEVCLTSNQQTNPAFRRLEDHPFRKMMEHRLSVTLCTDNRLVSNTTVTDEVLKAVTTFGLSAADLKNIIVYGFKRSFCPGEYAAKREYVRKCMDYFEALVGE